MGEQPFVPGDVPEEDAIGTKAAAIGGGQQFGKDILVGILAGGGVPRFGGVGRAAGYLVKGAAELVPEQSLEQPGGVDLAPVRHVADQVEIEPGDQTLV